MAINKINVLNEYLFKQEINEKKIHRKKKYYTVQTKKRQDNR